MTGFFSYAQLSTITYIFPIFFSPPNLPSPPSPPKPPRKKNYLFPLG